MKNIVIIDDDVEILKIMFKLLTMKDHVVHTFQKASEAIKAMTHINPDVVIVDFMMLEMDGFDTIQACRDNGTFCQYIMLSAYGAHDIYEACLKHDIKFMIKPAKFNDLLLMIGE